MTEWPAPLQVAATTLGIYAATLAGVRVAGRRTLARMSAFDFLVTVALGTVVGSTSLSPSIGFLDGLAALATLLAAQLLLGTLRRRSRFVRRVVDFAPMTIVEDGVVDHRALAKAQMAPDDLEGRLRSSGAWRSEAVAIAILESTGDVSVFRRPPPPPDGSEEVTGGP